MVCPRCGFEGTDPDACPKCGVVFSKLAGEAAAAAKRGVAPSSGAGRTGDPTGRDPLVPRDALRPLGIGVALALLCHAVPFLRFVFTYLIILIHELGHAMVGWLFGYPSIPAFDFAYGGGLTFHEDRKWVIVGLVVLGIGIAVHRLRHRSRLAGVVACGGLAYVLVSLTRVHEVLQIAAGHGAELVVAGWFLYRALAGTGLRVEAERPAYAFSACFILLGDVRFAWGLFSSAAQRAAYAAAKGGGDWMDFSRLARDYLGTGLQQVSAAFLVMTLAVPVAVLWVHASRDRVAEILERLAAPRVVIDPGPPGGSPARL